MPKDKSAELLASELKRTNKLLGKKNAFYRGVISGLGATIGATILISIVLWALSQLEYIPFLGSYIKPANEVIRQNVPNTLP